MTATSRVFLVFMPMNPESPLDKLAAIQEQADQPDPDSDEAKDILQKYFGVRPSEWDPSNPTKFLHSSTQSKRNRRK